MDIEKGSTVTDRQRVLPGEGVVRDLFINHVNDVWSGIVADIHMAQVEEPLTKRIHEIPVDQLIRI
jgi:hypothetical protein